jgi:apolipoprotein N-acyltransferase
MRKKLFTALQRHYYLLTSLGMFLSFPSFDLWCLKAFPLFAWISLVPLFASVRGKPMREVFVSVFITGLAGNLITYQWIGNFGAEVSGGYTVILLFLVPALTGFFTAKILVAEYLSRRFERLRMLIYPAAWIGVDWIQSVGHLAFPWTYWGYSQYPFTALIQLASVTGVMGVTFLVVLGNCALADLWFFHPRAGRRRTVDADSRVSPRGCAGRCRGGCQRRGMGCDARGRERFKARHAGGDGAVVHRPVGQLDAQPHALSRRAFKVHRPRRGA